MRSSPGPLPVMARSTCIERDQKAAMLGVHAAICAICVCVLPPKMSVLHLNMLKTSTWASLPLSITLSRT